MVIEHYSFGEIVIDGNKYSNDLIVFKDKVKSWWRKEGHLLHLEDIEEIIKEKPEILIVGTGSYGVMKVEESVKEFLKEKGIKLVEKNSKEACDEFNKLKNKNVVLAIHLTC
jgi:hypothetical protein